MFRNSPAILRSSFLIFFCSSEGAFAGIVEDGRRRKEDGRELGNRRSRTLGKRYRTQVIATALRARRPRDTPYAMTSRSTVSRNRARLSRIAAEFENPSSSLDVDRERDASELPSEVPRPSGSVNDSWGEPPAASGPGRYPVLRGSPEAEVDPDDDEVDKDDAIEDEPPRLINLDDLEKAELEANDEDPEILELWHEYIDEYAAEFRAERLNRLGASIETEHEEVLFS